MTERLTPHANRVLSAVLPGLPQIAAGRWGAGSVALGTWAGLLALLFARTDQVIPAIAGGWDDRLALVTLVAALVGSWIWSWRDVGRETEGREEGVSQWRLAVRVFARNRTAVLGLLVIGAVYLVALLTPLITTIDPTAQPDDLVGMRLRGFSAQHWLGTDQLGRDVFARLLYGARISLTIGFLAMGIAATVGTLIGAVAGFIGGMVDTLIMRCVDMVISFPRLILLITIIAVFDTSIFVIVMVLGFTLWPSTARIVRAEVLSLREQPFVQAAHALGYSKRRIILRHLVPNALAPVIVAATLGIGHTIVLEAGLSFLGLGFEAPTPSWGLMVADGRTHMVGAWWLSTVPGMAIVLTVLSFNLVGDGLRDALDPRLRS